MWNNIASNVLTLLIVLIVVIVGAVQWGQRQYVAVGPLENAICLKISSGSVMTKVVNDLAGAQAISSPRIFRLGADYSGKSSALKAGSYLITPQSSMQEILEVITTSGRSTCGSEIVIRAGVARTSVQMRTVNPETGRYDTFGEFDLTAGEKPQEYIDLLAAEDTRIRFIVIEGTTAWQVTQALNAMEFLQTPLTKTPTEGYLAPDSYEILRQEKRPDIIAKMKARQDARLAKVWGMRAEDLPIKTPDELLILASIIEKETGRLEEQAQVASVFVNRLRRGMKLQTDPTVIYGVTQGKGVLGRGLRQSELRKNTPWNTYVIPALPPTAIANPSLAALQAAAQPDQTPYVFFVADGSGGHAFSVTLQEHNRNVAKWRKIEAERANQ